jgi:UDP-3-O-[3-hydroxymyristoyl] glucosamine N-acyltransferase
MKMTLADVAERIGGVLQGDGGIRIAGAAPFETAGPDQITYAETAKLLKKIEDTRAGAVIVPIDFSDAEKPMIKSTNPKVAFAKVMGIFYPRKRQPEGIHPTAVVGKNFRCGGNAAIGAFVVIQDDVTLGERVTLHPHVVVGDGVVIGDDTEIFPNASILQRCVIGSRVMIQSGTVVGSDGFGFAPEGERYCKIPHIGIVQIDDDVEIGACNTIDRATFGKTWIQKGVKTDNLVQIAHNVTVGENTVLVAQVGISGSVTIGKHAVIAGQAGISGHLTIGDGAIIGPQTGVVRSVPEKETVSGSPERPHLQHVRIQSLISKLPEFKKRLDEIEKRLKEMGA